MEQNKGVYKGSAKLRESDVEGIRVAPSQFQIVIEFDSGKTLNVKSNATYSVEGAFENLDLSDYEEESIQKVTVVKIR